jgi:hypothetical protein
MTLYNWLGGTLSGPKRPIFRYTSQIFAGRSGATACKNLLRLVKNGHFFISDATTLTSYEVVLNVGYKNFNLPNRARVLEMRKWG